MPAPPANATPLIISFTGTQTSNSQVSLTWVTASCCTAATLSGQGVVAVSQNGQSVTQVVTVTGPTTFVLTAFATATNQIETAEFSFSNIPNAATTIMPTGSIIAWAGPMNALPPGWLLCDGTPYPISTYPELAALLGAAYGNGQGATFLVPDMVNRFVVGASGNSAAAAQTSGPADSHTHGISAGFAQITTNSGGVHSHGMPSKWYFETLSSGRHHSIKTSQIIVPLPYSAPNNGILPSQTGGDHAHSATVSFESFSSDGITGTVAPPWLTLCYIIKV